MIERMVLADPIKRGAFAGIVWAVFVVVSNLFQEYLNRPFLLSGYESLFEAGFACLLAWGVVRRSRVCAAFLFVQILGRALSGALLLEDYAVAIMALPFLYMVGQATRAILEHHRENPSESSRFVRLLAFSAESAVVAAFALLIVLTLESPPTRIVPGVQLPAAYVSELRSLALVEPDERVLFFYSPALKIREEMYILTDSKLIAYGEEWVSNPIVARFDGIAEVEFEHEPSWWADSTLIVRLVDGTELFIPLSSEGGGDRRFHARLEELLDQTRRKLRGEQSSA